MRRHLRIRNGRIAQAASLLLIVSASSATAQVPGTPTPGTQPGVPFQCPQWGSSTTATMEGSIVAIDRSWQLEGQVIQLTLTSDKDLSQIKRAVACFSWRPRSGATLPRFP